MSSVFSDDFSSYSVGSHVVPPWELEFGLGGTVVAGGFRGQGFQFNAAGGIRRNTGGLYYNNLTIYCYFKYPNASYNSNIIEVSNGLTTDGDPTAIMLWRLGFETDGTLTMITQGVFMDNSGSNLGYSLYPNKWYFLQANLIFDVTGGGFVNCLAQVALDGTIVLDSVVPITSNQLAANLVSKHAEVNRFSFRDLSSLSIIDEINVVAPHDVIPTYPNPGGTVNDRTTQLIIEPAQLITDSRELITQMINEYAELPDNGRMRITQMIIEIAATGTIANKRGWRVREF